MDNQHGSLYMTNEIQAYNSLDVKQPNFSEAVFKNQKKEISEIMERNKTSKSEKSSILVPQNNKNFIILNDFHQEKESTVWLNAIFNTEFLLGEEFPVIKSTWKEAKLDNDWKGIEITGFVFRSNQEINLESDICEIFFDITLKRESTFWLILRSNNCLDKRTAVLKITKEDRSQKIFASFGTFVLDKNSDLIFKVFIKQQIINFTSDSSQIYKENDISRVKGVVIDNGQDKIVVKIYLNDDKTENILIGTFFLPFTEAKNHIMLAGNGYSCVVKSFFAREIEAEDSDNITLGSEKRNCECCMIY